MSKTIKLVSLSAAIALSVGLLGGCGGDKKAKAYDLAQEALTKANEAKMCCEMKTERHDRMFEKAMLK